MIKQIEMDVQAAANEICEIFNGLGCIKYRTSHTPIGTDTFSEVDVPCKTQVSLSDRIQVELHQMAESFWVNLGTTDWVMATVWEENKVTRMLKIEKTNNSLPKVVPQTTRWRGHSIRKCKKAFSLEYEPISPASPTVWRIFSFSSLFKRDVYMMMIRITIFHSSISIRFLGVFCLVS